jgi:hypothetical protein
MHHRGLRAPHVPKRACGIRAHKPHPLSRFLDLEQMLSCRAIDKNLSSGGQDGYNTPSCGWGGGYTHTWSYYWSYCKYIQLKTKIMQTYIWWWGQCSQGTGPGLKLGPQVLLVLAPLLACLNNGNPGDDSLGKLPVFQKDRRGKETKKVQSNYQQEWRRERKD